VPAGPVPPSHRSTYQEARRAAPSAPAPTYQGVDKFYFLANDCDDPRAIVDVSLRPKLADCQQRVTVAQEKNVTFKLLQTADAEPIAAHRCYATFSRRVYYCGTFDHTTPMENLWVTDAPMLLSAEECNRILNDGEWTPKDPARFAPTFTVHPNTVNNFKVFIVGRTYGLDGEGKCEGADFPYGSMTLRRAVVVHDIRLEFRPVTLKLSETQGFVDITNNIVLDCDSRARSCEGKMSGTYVWEGSHRTCQLQVVQKEVRGLLVTDNTGRDVLMSVDGSLLRFILRDPVSLCNEIVRVTNYPKLYVFMIIPGHSNAFITPLKPYNVDIYTYVQNRDDFLYASILQQVEQEVNAVLNNDCVTRNEQVTSKQTSVSAEASQLNVYQTDNRTFAVDVGEVAYQFSCRPILVRAHQADMCYTALPVVVNPAAPVSEHRTMFMEPLTRRLSKFGIGVPCHPHFKAKYMNVRGDWVLVGPELHLAAAPQVELDYRPAYIDLTPTLDFAHGGVYSEADIRANVEYMQFRDARISATFQLADQVGRSGFVTGQEVRLGGMFPKDPITSWFASFSSTFMRVIQACGQTASIIVVAVFFWQAMASLASMGMSFWFVKGARGCSLGTMLAACCPTFYLLRRYRDMERRDPSGAYRGGEEMTEFLPITPIQNMGSRNSKMNNTASVSSPGYAMPPTPPPPPPPVASTEPFVKAKYPSLSCTLRH